MKTTMLVLASALVASIAISTVDTVAAQGMQNTMDHDMMPSGTDQQQPMARGMAQGMDRGMMRGDMDMMCPMMRSGMMQRGMMGPGMMDSSATPGGMGPLFGSRVTQEMNLSVDDVRGYLAARLNRLNNKRLKLGDINSGDETITADIVTVDNSLVQRLKVDRHTGSIAYEN